MPTGNFDYRKTRKELLMQLLEESNPGLTAAVGETELKFGGVAVVTPTVGPKGLDTSIIVEAVDKTLISGRSTVQYRRIDLAKLFRSRTIVVYKWLATSTITNAELRQLLLDQYGVRLEADEFTANVNASTDTAVTVLSTSPCYKGGFTVRWEKGKRDISELSGDHVLNGRNWPDAMVDVGDGTKPQGELLLYNLDFSSQRSLFNSWSSGTVLGVNDSGAQANAINAVLNAAGNHLGYQFSNETCDKQGGVFLLTTTRYALPNAAIPEANSKEYKFCLVLENKDYPGYPPYFNGKIILHYN